MAIAFSETVIYLVQEFDTITPVAKLPIETGKILGIITV